MAYIRRNPRSCRKSASQSCFSPSSLATSPPRGRPSLIQFARSGTSDHRRPTPTPGSIGPARTAHQQRGPRYVGYLCAMTPIARVKDMTLSSMVVSRDWQEVSVLECILGGLHIDVSVECEPQRAA